MRLPDVVADLDRLSIEAAPLPTDPFAGFCQSRLKTYVELARRFQLTAE